MSNTPLIDQLVAVRQHHRLIADVPEDEKPHTLDEAYAVADALAAEIGQPVAGWKIGASIPRAWQHLGLTEPFGGRIFADTVYSSPALLEDTPGTLTIGAEFALRIAQDLSTDVQDYTAESIRTMVDAVYPVLELNRPSYERPMEIGGLSLIADNGVNYGLVHGEPIPDWQSVDLQQVTVTLVLNDEDHSQGIAADIGFDPVAVLAWFANDRARRGDPLRKGQLISSGDLIGPVEANPGDRVIARFDTLDQVEVRV
jgi:2-keto-4-pentenoate hydratase